MLCETISKRQIGLGYSLIPNIEAMKLEVTGLILNTYSIWEMMTMIWQTIVDGIGN